MGGRGSGSGFREGGDRPETTAAEAIRASLAAVAEEWPVAPTEPETRKLDIERAVHEARWRWTTRSSTDTPVKAKKRVPGVGTITYEESTTPSGARSFYVVIRDKNNRAVDNFHALSERSAKERGERELIRIASRADRR